MKKIFAGIAVLLITGSMAFAAGIDGKWAGTLTGPQGELPVSFTFKANGPTLTGSTQGFDGTEVPIKDGKIDGANISFSVVLDFGGMPFVLTYKGVVSGDTIKVTGDAVGMPFEFSLKKAQ